MRAAFTQSFLKFDHFHGDKNLQCLASSAFFTCNNTSDRKSNGVCKTFALNGVAFSVYNYADVFPSYPPSLESLGKFHKSPNEQARLAIYE